ncbi:hypothetical protein BGZ89_004141 [Linnemannia elongata]|nr:hypothetical protein BGZ89_004141 [Linnemannia elongata]
MQEAEREDILDISQNGQLDSLGSLKARITEGVFKASLGNPAYYLYQAERSILQTYADEMASLIADRSSIIELGAGSLEKTRVADGIDYYALDINRNALVESLASLPVLKKIKCHGLFGTYNDGLYHVAKLQRRSDVEKVPHVFVWLGSSIGNLTVEGAVAMVKSIADVMVDGDMILIGIDGWASDTVIDAAYEPADKLVLNTLMNANEILGQAVFDMSKFVYSAQVNHLEGRNECCYMASEAVELNYQGETVRMERGERILVVPSYKYADEQVVDMVKATGCLEVVRRFGTPDDAEIHYGVWMWRKTARSTMSSK